MVDGAMLSRRLLLWGSALGAVGASLPVGAGRANAGTFRAVSVEQLARTSRTCVVARALQSESRWVALGGKRRIVTDTRIAVEERIAGDLDDAEIIVRTLGGQVGDIGQIAHGEAVLTRKSSGLTFLSQWPGLSGVFRVTAMAQGHYPIAERGGERRVLSSPRLGKLVGTDASSATTRLNQRVLPTARTMIQKAWVAR